MREIVFTGEKGAGTQDLFGIFFEDINHSADGGLYAEKVQNRAFEFSPVDGSGYRPLTAWEKVEEGGARISLFVSDKNPYSSKNPHYLVMSVENPGVRAGVKNTGFNTGISLEKGKNYIFSCYAKSAHKCRFTVSLESAEGKIYAASEFTISGNEWTKYEFTLTSDAEDSSAVLVLATHEKCKAMFDFVSLFPMDTFLGRKNGLRADLAALLKELKPAFVRFPGGCLVHDGSLNSDDRNSCYRWKNTIGPIEERPARRNNWGYNQTLGLGFYEYFLFCEDIGAAPLPVLPAGYNPHMGIAAPLDEMDEWVDDALDLIEFANGDKNTKWGSIRAKLGHPLPFNLKYLAIGNEEVGQEFFDRYDIIHKAVREKYPDIMLINSAGPFPAGGEFERGWNNAKKNCSDFVDEHYYTSPEWMLANIHRYDAVASTPNDTETGTLNDTGAGIPNNAGAGTLNDAVTAAPKVFLGEYATWGNLFYNALAEAAYMTALENNACRVGLACYAPLLCNVDYKNWAPDLIWFDNHRVAASVNYYVQKFFMTGRGKNLLCTRLSGMNPPIVCGENNIKGEIALFTENCKGEIWDIELHDLEHGILKKIDPMKLGYREGKTIGNISSNNYKITFKAKKSIGHNGFRLEFGKTDLANLICWNIGGWDNRDTEISARVNGRATTLDQNIFSVNKDTEYDLELIVNGREIKTYINGVLSNNTIHKNTVIEDLYVSATEDDGYIYLKVVNVRDTDAETHVNISGDISAEHKIFTLSAPDNAENTLDDPFNVTPAEKSFMTTKDGFTMIFKGKSVNLLVLKK